MRRASSSGLTSLRLRPANSAGRSIGMPLSLLFVKVPWMSGSPHGVRGIADDCAPTIAVNSVIAAPAPTSVRVKAFIDRVLPGRSEDPPLRKRPGRPEDPPHKNTHPAH